MIFLNPCAVLSIIEPSSTRRRSINFSCICQLQIQMQIKRYAFYNNHTTFLPFYFHDLKDYYKILELKLLWCSCILKIFKKTNGINIKRLPRSLNSLWPDTELSIKHKTTDFFKSHLEVGKIWINLKISSSNCFLNPRSRILSISHGV